jgi:hypothetical protein
VLGAFPPRREDAREFALRYRVLLVRTHGGVDVDIALGALPFEERSVERSSKWEWTPGQSLTTCSAEDLISGGSGPSRLCPVAVPPGG